MLPNTALLYSLMCVSKKLNESAPCAPCQRPADTAGTMLPERYVVRCDAAVCMRQEVNPAGLGDGRAYK